LLFFLAKALSTALLAAATADSADGIPQMLLCASEY
jgi:hypothetical protein